MRLSLQRLPRQAPCRGRHRTLAVGKRVAFAADPSDIAPRNIWCVGRNYPVNVGDLDKNVDAPTEAPMIFLKAGSSLLDSGKTLALPSWSTDVQLEVALAVELDDQLQPKRAAIALDLTACDVQAKLTHQQWAWTLAKNFPHSTLFPVKDIDLHQLELLVEVNGETRQRGNTSHMIFKIPALLEYIQNHFPALPGDLVLTGLPAGSSALKPGDKVVAQILLNSTVLNTGNWEVAPGDTLKQRATQKIVINAAYGGYGLSSHALHAYAIAKGLPLDPNYVEDVPGDDHDNGTDDHDGEHDDNGTDDQDGEHYDNGTDDQNGEHDDVDEEYDDYYEYMYGSGRNNDPGYAGSEKWKIPRDDPDLLRIVEELGRRAHRRGDRLEIIEVPAGVRWGIGEYDGLERVEEIHNSWTSTLP